MNLKVCNSEDDEYNREENVGKGECWGVEGGYHCYFK